MCLARHLFKIVYSTKSNFQGTLYSYSLSPLQDVQNVNDLKKEGLFKSILFLFSRAATAVFT